MRTCRVGLFFLSFGLVGMNTAAGEAVYPGNGNEPQGAEALLVYPDITSDTLVYHLGQPRHFRIRYAGNIDPATFSAELNGRDVSKRFRPVPGSEQNVFLRLKRGENQLFLQIAGEDTEVGTAYADLDVFNLELKGPHTRGGLRDAPPPGFEHRTLPPAPAEVPGKPNLIDKSER